MKLSNKCNFIQIYEGNKLLDLLYLITVTESLWCFSADCNVSKYCGSLPDRIMKVNISFHAGIYIFSSIGHQVRIQKLEYNFIVTGLPSINILQYK